MPPNTLASLSTSLGRASDITRSSIANQEARLDREAQTSRLANLQERQFAAQQGQRQASSDIAQRRVDLAEREFDVNKSLREAQIAREEQQVAKDNKIAAAQEGLINAEKELEAVQAFQDAVVGLSDVPFSELTPLQQRKVFNAADKLNGIGNQVLFEKGRLIPTIEDEEGNVVPLGMDQIAEHFKAQEKNILGFQRELSILDPKRFGQTGQQAQKGTFVNSPTGILNTATGEVTPLEKPQQPRVMKLAGRLGEDQLVSVTPDPNAQGGFKVEEINPEQTGINPQEVPAGGVTEEQAPEGPIKRFFRGLLGGNQDSVENDIRSGL